MTTLKIGDKLKDNDPRQSLRSPLEVIDLLDGTRVTARTGAGLYVKIRVSRIHSDGKKRKTGFDLVRDQA